MYSDANSVVRVKRYYKTVVDRTPLTQEKITYKVFLDWGIGQVDRGNLAIFGSPYQLFSNNAGGIYGDVTKDTRVLVEEVELPFSNIQGAAQPLVAGVLHFEHPNI
jgi:hypothetical protein